MVPGGRMRFPIRFDTAYRMLSMALLISPSKSFVEVDDEEVRVRMAWAFLTRFQRSAIRSVTSYNRRPVSRGVHGWAGRWLVNGSGKGIITIWLKPGERAYVLGFPVQLRELLVSVEDPEGVMTALGR